MTLVVKSVCFWSVLITSLRVTRFCKAGSYCNIPFEFQNIMLKAESTTMWAG